MPTKDRDKQRAYARKHYEANRPAMIARAAVAKQKLNDEIRVLIRAAKAVPCMDCGLSYPYYVMQFDHVRGEKLFSIGNFVAHGFGKAKVLAEIQKCEVVCGNCHAERTHQRSAVEQSVAR